MDARRLRSLAEDELAQRAVGDEASTEHSPLLYELRIHQIMLRLQSEEAEAMSASLDRLGVEMDRLRATHARTRSVTSELDQTLQRAQESIADLSDAPVEWQPPILADLRRAIEHGSVLVGRLRGSSERYLGRPPKACATEVGTEEPSLASATVSGERLRSDVAAELLRKRRSGS